MIYDIHNYYINKFFDELKNLPVPIRQSMIYKYYTENVPVYIKDEDLFAGWFGFCEGSEEFLKKPENFDYIEVLNESQKNLHRFIGEELKTGVFFTAAHTLIDYETIINKGLIYYLDKVREELKKSPDNDMLKAMEMSIESTINYAKRFQNLAKELIEKADNNSEKERLSKIYNALSKVPEHPATDFLEAVQSVWIMHSLIPVAEQCWGSISIGRIDQYLYPFYEKAIENGTNVEEIKSILKQLFLMLDSYGDGACAMNIGGMDIDGNDMLNELSEVLISVEKEMLLRAPIFAFRVNNKTPDRVLDKMIDFDLFKIGQPTFYGEMPSRKAVMGRDIPEKDAARFSVNSCMGLILAGEEFADMWGIKFNMHLPLELSVNYGKPFNCDLPFELKTEPKEIKSYEDLIKQYEKYIEEIAEISAEMYELKAKEAAENYPDPLLSALTDGCIENRKDRAVGAKYNTVTVETMGMINTCDAISAICELVFNKEKYTLSELIDAAKCNFYGADEILRDLRKCKKYGENDEKVNMIVKTVSEITSKVLKKQRKGNMIFIPSLHTIDLNVGYGLNLYATLDGRMAGEPVNKNANPSTVLQKTEPTSVVLSATAIKQTEFSGGQPIDIYFDKSWFDTKESRDKIKQLILTYFKLGGLQFQVNSIDLELLKKAHKSPFDYPFVIVRKGGFSLRFNEMGEKERADFINSVEKSE